MKTKTNFVLVGLFVLVLATAFIAAVLWLGSGGAGRTYDEYLVYMEESVSGLGRDSTVKYYGVDVGRVREIALDANDQRRVRLLLQIEQGTPVREDTVASLETQGLTGLSYINLSGGSPASPALQAREGEDYPVIRSEPSIWGRLDRSLGELVDNLIEASQRVNRLLSDENQQLISSALAQVEELARTLAGRTEALTGTIDGMAGTADNLREASARLPQLVDKLQSTADALEHMADEIGTTAVTVRQTIEGPGRDVNRFTREALPEVTEMVRELRLAAEHFRRFSEELERNPGVLLRGRQATRPGPGE